MVTITTITITTITKYITVTITVNHTIDGFVFSIFFLFFLFFFSFLFFFFLLLCGIGVCIIINTATAFRRYNSPNDTFNKSGIPSEYNADCLVCGGGGGGGSAIDNHKKDDEKVEENVDDNVSLDTGIAAEVEAESRTDEADELLSARDGEVLNEGSVIDRLLTIVDDGATITNTIETDLEFQNGNLRKIQLFVSELSLKENADKVNRNFIKDSF